MSYDLVVYLQRSNMPTPAAWHSSIVAAGFPVTLDTDFDVGGPTASGLDGYVCEKCAEFLVAQTKDYVRVAALPCGYCGRSPAYAAVHGRAVCSPCAVKGLAAARNWYSDRRDSI